MATSFAALKKSRSKEFDKLTDKLKSMDKGSNVDERYWKLEVDKNGNGYAIIRFLPAPQGEDMPFVRLWNHSFKGPGGWFIENSRTTIGEDDPVSEYNTKLWNSGVDANRDIVSKFQKRRLSYHANIYVVKDPSNPENEGKVFLFRFGKSIYDMINDAMHPRFEDDTPINPFDFWEGADFKIKAYNDDDGWRKYTKSEFTEPGVMKKPDGKEMTDKELEKIWESEYSLKEIIDPKNFKSYEELQKRLHKVLKIEGDNTNASTGSVVKEDDEMDFIPNFESEDKDDGDEIPFSDDSDDDEDDEEFFKKLAEED